jgi:hypothetical protein
MSKARFFNKYLLAMMASMPGMTMPGGMPPALTFAPPQKGEGRRRVSKYMPHQNTRQRARYTRQIAAGQLNMEISP